MEFPEINYLAVLISALAFFVLGSLWYSPVLFANAWMKELSFTRESMAGGNMFKTFGLSFLLMLIMAFNLAAFIGNGQGFQFGMTAGALTGIGWVALAIGINYLYERKSFRIWLINAGYMAIGFTIMGAIIGAWQ
jgi:hypothetical protein